MSQAFSERILFEDNHLLLVNKLASELVQGDKTGDECLLDQARAYLKWKYNKPGEAFIGLVHRIDRPVSGVLLLAKTSKALSRLTVQLKNHDWQKVYLAAVKNAPPKTADSLTHFFGKERETEQILRGKSRHEKCQRSATELSAARKIRPIFFTGSRFTHRTPSPDQGAISGYWLSDKRRSKIRLQPIKSRWINKFARLETHFYASGKQGRNDNYCSSTCRTALAVF